MPAALASGQRPWTKAEKSPCGFLAGAAGIGFRFGVSERLGPAASMQASEPKTRASRNPISVLRIMVVDLNSLSIGARSVA